MKKQNRREFIKKSFAAGIGLTSLPYFIPSNIFSKNGNFSPSDKVTMACIGVGWQGTSNLRSFLGVKDCKIVAVCDIDQHHLNNAKNIVDKYYGNSDCKTYHYYEEVLQREDIDVVSIALPDHWHAIPAVAAARAGKDIYGEKPLSHNLVEGRAIVNAVKKYNRIWQTGSWQRSVHNFRFACELVRNGKIGKVHSVEVGLPDGQTDFEGTGGQEDPIAPPEWLDYDRWLGPAPYAPYAPARVHKNWRWNLDYGGGQLMDWVGHHVDIAHWGLNMDYDAPIEIEGEGTYPNTGLWNSATRYRIDSKYANGIKMIIAGGHKNICNGKTGTKWIGDEGWIHVNRGSIDASRKSILNEKIKPNEINLYNSPGHFENFIECVKSRKQTLAPAEVAHRSATPGHLGQIAMLLKKKIYFDPATEQIIGDPIASRLLGRPMRSPYHL